MEGGRFSKLGSRLGAAHIRLKSLKQLHGWRAGGFQNGVIALSPRTFVFKVCNSYTDGGQVVFKMGLPLWRRAHSSSELATVTRMEGGSFSKWGSRLGAADIRLKSLQQLHGWRAVPFQNGVPALAPRTFVFKVCNSYTGGGRAVFKMGLSPWHRGHQLHG